MSRLEGPAIWPKLLILPGRSFILKVIHFSPDEVKSERNIVVLSVRPLYVPVAIAATI